MTTLMEAVAAATTADPRLHPLNKVPLKPTYPYGSYSASFGRGDTFTNDGTESVRWGRIVVQTFGRTADSALDLAEDVRAALVGQILNVTGYQCSPVRSELDPAVSRDPDDNSVVGVTTTLTLTAAKE